MVGKNIHIRVWRITHPTDDEVGGAIATGTILYDDLECRLSPMVPDPLLLQQGFEFAYDYRIDLRSIVLVYKEIDEVEIIKPTNHPEIASRMQVMRVNRTPFHPDDSRAFTTLYVRKRKYAYQS